MITIVQGLSWITTSQTLTGGAVWENYLITHDFEIPMLKCISVPSLWLTS